ncbi:MAG: hydrogenase iron-sulfur subunit [Syntrophobacterales bacterium]
MTSQVTIVVLACRQAVPKPEEFSGPLERAGLKARVIREPCSSKVEVFQMLRTLADEADLLWVVGCPPEACQLVEGSTRMAKRVGHAQEYLQDIGLEPERLGMVYLPFGSQDIISATVKEIQQRARTLGINPARAGAGVTKEQA